MRVSVILAAHNEGNQLWQTLLSIMHSSHGLTFETIVADDASWDGSIEEAQR